MRRSDIYFSTHVERLEGENAFDVYFCIQSFCRLSITNILGYLNFYKIIIIIMYYLSNEFSPKLFQLIPYILPIDSVGVAVSVLP